MDRESNQDQERSSENTTEHSWQRLWTMSFDPYNGYVQNLEDAMALLREYEIETTSRFTQTAQTAKFGSTDDLKKKRHRLYWSESQDISCARMEFDGCSYMVLGKKRMECQNGPDRNRAKKSIQSKQKQQGKDTPGQIQRILTQNTKKVSCPAVVLMREIASFPNYKITYDTKRAKESTSRKIQEDLKSSSLQVEKRIYISLPEIGMRLVCNHFVGEDSTWQSVKSALLSSY